MSLYTTECRLTASGLDDLILPISTVSVRMRHQLASYMSWTLPDPLPYTDQIIDRISGNMLLYCSIDGGELVQVLRTFLRSIYFTQGSKNMVLTLAGDRQISFASVISHLDIDKVISQKRNDDETHTLDVHPDFSITPRFTVDFGKDSPLRLNTVFFNIYNDRATMTITGPFEAPLEYTMSRWMLDEGEGTYIEDIGQGLDGEIIDPAATPVISWVETPAEGPAQDYCLNFTYNYDQDRVGVETAYYLPVGNLYPMTIEAWVRLSSGAPRRLVVVSNLGDWRFDHLSDFGPIFIFYLDWGYLALEITNNEGEAQTYYFGETEDAANYNEWAHVAVVLDNGEVRFYLNGVQSELWDGWESEEFPLGGQQPYPLLIGHGYDLGTFRGQIADVRIWSEARTEQQIYDNMMAGKGDL